MQRLTAKHYGFQDVFFRSVTFNAQQAMEQAYEYEKTGKINESIQMLTTEAIRAIEDDDADVLALGCNGLAWAVAPAKVELSQRGYDVPFIIPLTLGVEVAKALVNLRLVRSNLFYPQFD
jgi:Asp/Glu/hydantoin racemase